jgi:hypothetical protein
MKLVRMAGSSSVWGLAGTKEALMEFEIQSSLVTAHALLPVEVRYSSESASPALVGFPVTTVCHDEYDPRVVFVSTDVPSHVRSNLGLHIYAGVGLILDLARAWGAGDEGRDVSGLDDGDLVGAVAGGDGVPAYEAQ